MKADSVQWPALALLRGWPVRSQLIHSSLGPGLVLQSSCSQEQLRPAETSHFLRIGAGRVEDILPQSGLEACPGVQWSNLCWHRMVICSSIHPSTPSALNKVAVPSSPWGAARLGEERKRKELEDNDFPSWLRVGETLIQWT